MWFHILAAKSKGLTNFISAWASMVGASWPPTPLTAWQVTHPLETNSFLPRKGFMIGKTRLLRPYAATLPSCSWPA